MSVDKKKGLRKKPTYNELIEEIQLDEKIKLPNRQAMFLRNSPYLSFLDGETLTEMNAQQEKADKQTQVEHTIRQQAGETGGTASVLRAQQEAQRTQENADVFMDAQSDYGDSSQTQNAGAVGSGGSWNPNTGWNPQPDALDSWYLDTRPTTIVPEQDRHGFGPRVERTIKAHITGRDTVVQDFSNISAMISSHMGNEPHGDLVDSMMAQSTKRAIPTDDQGGKKTKTTNLESDYNKLMKESGQNLNKAIGAPPAPKAKSQPASSSSQGPNIFPKGNPTQPKAAPAPPPKSKPAQKPATTTGVKPSPAFQKKTQAPTAAPAPFRTHIHGTAMDTSTDKKHWQGKGLQYINDQLQKRGIVIPNKKLRGQNALKKKDLLDMLYKHDGI